MLCVAALSATVLATPKTAPAEPLHHLPAAVGGEPALPAHPADLIASACPTDRIRMSDLEAVRGVNAKLALAAAIRSAAEQRNDLQIVTVRERMAAEGYQRPSNAREAAAMIRGQYGSASLLARGADAVAALTTAAEERPLEGVNSITGTIIERSGRAFGLRNVPEFKLQPKIRGNKASVSLSTRW